MDAGASTYAADRRNLIVNLSLFTITSLALLVYTWVFTVHIINGLVAATTDKLVWLATLCSSIFYGQAVRSSYQTYVRRNGPQFSIGPFTILSTSVLPTSAIVSSQNPYPATPNNMTYLNSPLNISRPVSPSGLSPKFEYAPAMPQVPSLVVDDRSSAESGEATCPPTPDSVLSEATPQLITPNIDRSYFNYVPASSPRSARSFSGSRFIAGRVLLQKGEAGKGFEAEDGTIGLGMGRIGGEERDGRISPV